MNSRFRLILLSLIIVTSVIVGGLFLDQNKTTIASDKPTTAISLGVDQSQEVVIKVYYDSQEQLNAVAGELDIWEVHQLPGIGPGSGYAIVAVYPAQQDWLETLGYRVEIDQEKTTELQSPLAVLDPRYYYFDANYVNPNGLYMVNFLQETEMAFPNITQLNDIGDAWQGLHDLYHRDMWVMRITNEDPAYGNIADKPSFFLFANVHAREVTTPEMAIRYIKYFTSGYKGQGGYGLDPDVTWLVNHHVVYVLVSQNPDGHRVNEPNTSNFRRKNMDNDDGCTDPNSWGVDLNRNSSFMWGCCGGSSGSPCAETYRGPSRRSEPETQAFQDYFTLWFRDQNGDNGDDEIPSAAPENTTGIFITLHSYADEILWPWGFAPGGAPNDAQLSTIGRKLADITGTMNPTGYVGYDVDGATDDWVYGKFGIASFTYEIGANSGSCGDFFPAYGCQDGIDGMTRNFWAEMGPSFVYANKIARTPYMTSYGPDAKNVAVHPGAVSAGEPVDLTATIQDQRYSGDTLHPVMAAEYFIDEEGTDGTGTALEPNDGFWGETSEDVDGVVDTSSLSLGQHYILVHGKSNENKWGPFTAVFLYIVEPGVAPVIEGYVRAADTNLPIEDATVSAGLFNSITDPNGYYSMTVISGTYDMVAEAVNFIPESVSGIVAHNYQTIPQDFYLTPICTVFFDDVENGNQGWTAQSPWAITTEASNSPTHSWTDSPGGDYGNYRNISLTRTQSFDLSEATNVTVDFWHMYDTEAGYDFGNVEYSTNGGGSWTTIVSYDGTQTEWTEELISIPALDGQSNVKIRFRFTSDGGQVGDGWHVDDIAILASGPDCMSSLAPEAEFTSNTPVLFGQPMEFTNQTIGSPPLSFLWDFGDGVGGSTDTDPTYTYADIGTYDVTLIASNTLGIDSISHTVTVLPIAITSVDLSQVTQDPVYPLDSVDFSADLLPNDATKPYTYTIDYDDGMVITDISSLDPLLLSHVYTTVGLYTISIEALNEGMTDPVADSLDLTIVDPTPVAEFTSNSPVFLGQPVQFTNHTTGQEPITYAWDFGDGATSTQTDPSHTYASIGTYTVTLTVTGKGTDSVTHPVTVLPIALTSVDLTQVTPDPIYLSDTVEFSADLLPDDATMPYTYTIDYGDTISSTSIANDEPISLSHVYTAVGDYIVQIEVLNVGMTVPVTDSLDISVLVPGSPYAAFSANSPVQLGQAVEFANLTIGDEPITYQWDFGDGIGSSTDISPTYTYAEIGLYTVTLTATNDLGADSISHTVMVQPIAITSVDLTQVSTGTIFPGDTVEFSADLLPEDATKPYNYTIDYGDGTVISGTSDLDPYPFEHVFTSNGWHTVQISVWNAGMTDPVTNSLDILVAYKFLLPITVK